MKRIQILLPAYNGEAYIRKQLDSFVRLKNFDEIKVLVRDDGSTDGTVGILREYERDYGFEIITGENIGLADNVFELMRHCDMSCDYFSFSDQDDVWLPFKLDRAVAALDREDNSKPLMYSSCSDITDADLNVVGKTLSPRRPLSFYNAMIQNVCPGHTQVCNRELMKLVRSRYSSRVYMIDMWYYLAATAFGKVIFDDVSSTLYRQHGNNTMGYETGFIRKNLQRLKRARNYNSNRNLIMLRDFLNVYRDIMPTEYCDELEKFFTMQKGFFSRLGYIFNTRAYRQSGYEDILFKLMYLFGRYNTASLPVGKENT